MAFHTFGSGEVLTASNLNTFVPHSPSLYKVVAGKTAYTLSAAAATTITVTYGETFSTIICVVGIVRSGSNIDLIATLNGPPGVSTASVRIAEKSGSSVSISGDFHWIVVGT